MKKFTLLFVFLSVFGFAQMPNISSVWLNKNAAYQGTIGQGSDSEKLSVFIAISEQDKQKDQEYFISGTTQVQKFVSNFEGKLKITKYKDSRSQSTVYGEFDLAEDPASTHAGTIVGKFIYTFKWNRKNQSVEKQFIQFSGVWKSYDGKESYRVSFSNNTL